MKEARFGLVMQKYEFRKRPQVRGWLPSALFSFSNWQDSLFFMFPYLFLNILNLSGAPMHTSMSVCACTYLSMCVCVYVHTLHSLEPKEICW